MLDPFHVIKRLELRTCSVRIKCCHALKWSTCSYGNTEQQNQTSTSTGFKFSRGTEDGGSIVPLFVEHARVS